MEGGTIVGAESNSNTIPYTHPYIGKPYAPKFDYLHAPKYFTPREVALHNTEDDCWVSWLGNVYDITPLIKANKANPLLKPILKHAGEDISHWFDAATGELKSHVNALTETRGVYTPEGHFVGVAPLHPRTDFDIDSVKKPWWHDHESYWIGKLSQRTRKLRIVNTLVRDEHVLEVCDEETLSAIQDRYLLYNAHAKGYMWKRLGNLLDMTQTLAENGIPDESETYEKLGMDHDEFIPVIHLYFRYFSND